MYYKKEEIKELNMVLAGLFTKTTLEPNVMLVMTSMIHFASGRTGYSLYRDPNLSGRR